MVGKVEIMVKLARDPLTQVSFSIYENKGVFALLLGSGLSTAAGIPTGWEITLDLIRRIALAEDVAEQPDWAAWYLAKTGNEPSYSSLLAQLTSSREERRAIIDRYIEPTDQEREEGKKVPTPAHRVIARLVQLGYIRVIVTTNFDRLLENAMRELGVEPTMIASPDALRGAQPLVHATCTIIKLHGDYKDARIRNTDQELNKYPQSIDTLLDRILDEYGLVVCGWSGDWDSALRRAILRAPNRRYPIYWAVRRLPGPVAQELIDHRRARAITIASADSFFSGVLQRVETLQKTQRQDPVSIELLVGSMKRYLAKPEYRINLDDLVKQESERVLVRLDDPTFTPQAIGGEQQVGLRIGLYEAAVEPLARIVGVAGRWGDDAELRPILDVVGSLYRNAKEQGAGLTQLLRLRSYPAVLTFWSYGLGLVRAERWKTLHQFLVAPIAREYREPQRAVDLLFLWDWEGSSDEIWNAVEGQNRYAPLSDHLFRLFSEWSSSYVGLIPDFEILAGRFEMIGSLASFGANDTEELEKAMTRNPSAIRMPVGRVGWREDIATALAAEFRATDFRKALIEAKFVRSDHFIDLFLDNWQRLVRQLSWR